MDVSGWNGATEYDWWLHYNLTPDGPHQPLPLVVQSCAEAHEELSKLYQPLHLDPNIVCRLLGPGWGEDKTECATRCGRPDFPLFNRELDTLRWSGTARCKYHPRIPRLYTRYIFSFLASRPLGAPVFAQQTLG